MVFDDRQRINVFAAVEDGGLGGASQQCRDLARDAAAEFEQRSDHRCVTKGRGLTQGQQAAVAGD